MARFFKIENRKLNRVSPAGRCPGKEVGFLLYKILSDLRTKKYSWQAEIYRRKAAENRTDGRSGCFDRQI